MSIFRKASRLPLSRLCPKPPPLVDFRFPSGGRHSPSGVAIENWDRLAVAFVAYPFTKKRIPLGLARLLSLPRVLKKH